MHAGNSNSAKLAVLLILIFKVTFSILAIFSFILSSKGIFDNLSFYLILAITIYTFIEILNATHKLRQIKSIEKESYQIIESVHFR